MLDKLKRNIKIKLAQQVGKTAAKIVNKQMSKAIKEENKK